MIPHRSFLTVFLLSVVTCGIYWYYYMYRLTQDINQMTGDDGYYTDAAAVVLLSIITCGLYSWYWLYRQGGRLKRLADCNGVYCAETGTTYLIWAIIGSLVCGLGNLVAHYLLIKNFNNIADAYNAHFYFS